MLRIMIVDDNEGMRNVLDKAVKKAGYQVVAKAANGVEALEQLEKAKPDVAFVDVEMPEMDGIETAKRILDVDPKIAIVFATAFEEYRKEAFELYAYDYLMKPFAISRIGETLERIEKQKSGEFPGPIEKVEGEKTVDKLLLQHKDGISLVNQDDIVLIQRENRATAIYTAKEKHLSNETLSELEQRLPTPPFFRAHKSYIINVNHIKRIYPYGRWTYIVKFEGTDMDALLTQERYGILQRFFN